MKVPVCKISLWPSRVRPAIARYAATPQRHIFVLLLAAVWLLHVYLTSLNDPLGAAFDLGLVATSCVLKVASLFTLYGLLGLVHGALFRNMRRTLQAFGIWSGLAGALIVGMSLTRNWWAHAFTDGAVDYYAVVPNRRFELGASDWLPAWLNGTVTACELALAFMLAAITAFIGYRLGKAPRYSVRIACITCAVVLVLYLVWLPWFHWDYDNFHGDIFSGAIFFDLFPPWVVFANDPYTTIGVFFYLAAYVGDMVILWLARPRTQAGVGLAAP